MWKHKHTHHSNVHRLDDQWTPKFLIMTELGWERVGEPHILAVPCVVLSKLKTRFHGHLLPWHHHLSFTFMSARPTLLVGILHTFEAEVPAPSSRRCNWEWEPDKSSTIKPRLLFLTWPPEKYFYKQDGVLIFFWFSNVAFKFTLCWIWNLWVWKTGDISKAPRTVYSPGGNQLD